MLVRPLAVLTACVVTCVLATPIASAEPETEPVAADAPLAEAAPPPEAAPVGRRPGGVVAVEDDELTGRLDAHGVGQG